MLALVTTTSLTLASPATLKNPPPLLSTSQPLPFQYFAATWASDNLALYLASSFSIDCFILAESRLEEGVYVQSMGEEKISAMTVSTSGNIILGIGRRVIVMDYATGTGQMLKTFESHATSITALAVSNDGTLIVSVSSNGVHIHDLLAPAKHTSLHLPTSVSRSSINILVFHPHVRTRLLVCSGYDILVYDVAKPLAPVKIINVGQVAVGISCSPFSKSLVAVASTSSVNLIDLDKEKGLFKTILSPEPITSISFSSEGAAVYIAVQDGLRIINLRELDGEMKTISVAEVGQEVVCIAVQKRVKNMTASASAGGSSASNPLATSSSRVHAKVASTARSPLRPVVQRKNGIPPIKASISETLKKQGVVETSTPIKRTSSRGAFSPGRGTGNPIAGVLRTRVSMSRENTFNDIGSTPARSAARATSSSRSEFLGIRADPGESISTRLASLRAKETRVASGSSARSATTNRSNLNGGAKTQESLTRAPSTRSISSSKTTNTARSKTAGNGDDNTHTDLSSPDLPMDPVSPVSKTKIQSGMAARVQETSVMAGDGRKRTSLGANGAASSKGIKDKGKDKEVNVEANHDTDTCEPAEEDDEGTAQQAQEGELSMQVSPRRPTAPNWIRSPLRPPPKTFPMHSSASNAYELFQGLIADMQAKHHADIKALHIDMLRMGRGLRQEMEAQWGGEVRKLREENAKLREENDRLRRGY